VKDVESVIVNLQKCQVIKHPCVTMKWLAWRSKQE